MQFLKDLLFSFNKIFRRVSQNLSHSRGFKLNFKQHFRVVFTNSPCSFKLNFKQHFRVVFTNSPCSFRFNFKQYFRVVFTNSPCSFKFNFKQYFRVVFFKFYLNNIKFSGSFHQIVVSKKKIKTYTFKELWLRSKLLKKTEKYYYWPGTFWFFLIFFIVLFWILSFKFHTEHNCTQSSV